MCVYVQRANGIGFIRLHIPWPILSREAELQKIKVAVKKVGSLTQLLTHPGVIVLCHIEINWVAHFKTKEFYVRER